MGSSGGGNGAVIHHFDVLTGIYLHEQEWNDAWDMLDQHLAMQSSRKVLYHSQLDLDVAKRSESARPLKAIPVYIKYARWHIAQRDRKHYQIAVGFLSNVRELYRQLGNDSAWLKLIAELRTEFGTLRALQDEIKKAGL